MSCCICWCFLLLCNISQIATGVRYSESLRKKAQIARILIKFGCKLTCFRPVQSFDLGGGRMSLGCSKKLQKRWGTHVLRVLSKIEFCAQAPDFFIINFRLPYTYTWCLCAIVCIYTDYLGTLTFTSVTRLGRWLDLVGDSTSSMTRPRQ
jgi:hypothetical protein